MNSNITKRIFSSCSAQSFVSIINNHLPKRTFARSLKKASTQKLFKKKGEENASLGRDAELVLNIPLRENFRNLRKSEVNLKTKKALEEGTLEQDSQRTAILACESTKELFQLYENNKRDLSLVSCSTIFDRLVKFGMKEGQSRSKIAKDGRIHDLINRLKRNFHNLSRSSELTLLVNLVKLKYEDPELMKMMIESAKYKNEKLTQTSLSFLVWALAKFKIRDEEFLSWTADKLLEKPNLQITAASNILWGMSQLNFPHPQLIQRFSDQIVAQSDKIDPKLAPIIFHTFSNFRLRNYEVLDGLSEIIVENVHLCSIRNIANIITYCSNLNYINNRLIETLESDILKQLNSDDKAKATESETEENLDREMLDNIAGGKKPEEILEEIDELENSLMENSKEEINTIDISQIMVGFCRLKIMKSELFEVLEHHFLKNIQKATPKSLVHYSFAHSTLCTDVFRKVKNDSKSHHQLNRKTLRNIKKHNEAFYERVTPFILQKLNGFSSEDVLSFLVSASRPLVTKRVICKQIFKIGLDSVSKLVEKKASINKADFQQFLGLYHETLSKFVVNKNQISELTEEYTKFEFDTSKLNLLKLQNGSPNPGEHHEDEGLSAEERDEPGSKESVSKESLKQ